MTGARITADLDAVRALDGLAAPRRKARGGILHGSLAALLDGK